MQLLQKAGIPFLVGGAYAFERYTGIVRHTKDFDIFVRPADCTRALDAFAANGYHTELTYPHWLGKVFHADCFIDVIFSSGNAIAEVDDLWFTHSSKGRVLGQPVRLVPVEEMIWSKGFVMERERYDGADIAHLLRAKAASLDWPHLLDRFGPHWRVLLSYLVLFGYIYPDERHQVPRRVMRTLTDRLRAELEPGDGQNGVCQGTILSREQFLVDVDRWGYADARLPPHGSMDPEHVAHWTAAIDGRK
jgi:hypothetical protein